MKTKIMKLTIILLLTTLSLNAQTNNLSQLEFNNIEINGVLFDAVKATEGDEAELFNLYNTPMEIIDNNDDAFGEGTRKILMNTGSTSNFNNFEFSFNNINSSSYSPELFYLKTNQIKIKNTTYSIGETIYTFGNPLQIKEHSDGSKSVIFALLGYDCCPFIISVNSEGIIIKIEYFVWT